MLIESPTPPRTAITQNSRRIEVARTIHFHGFRGAECRGTVLCFRTPIGHATGDDVPLIVTRCIQFNNYKVGIVFLTLIVGDVCPTRIVF